MNIIDNPQCFPKKKKKHMAFARLSARKKKEDFAKEKEKED